MKIRLFTLTACIVSAVAALGQTPGQSPAKHEPEVYNPVANPAATVVFGNARFEVLTPQLIRMEWAQDGRFEDHASFAFLNRSLPAPAFQQHVDGDGDGRTLVLETHDLTLTYHGGKNGQKFDAKNLSVKFHVGASEVTWAPGMQDPDNLKGTARTLDRVRGDDVTLEPGLISRSGWALVDDSSRPLFDSADFSMSKGLESEWPWVKLRPAGDRLDWYFFGYGHEYEQELGDFIRVAGRIPLPPRFAFGSWWSRYWAYSDQDLNDIVDGYRSRSLPLDVLVIDMDWHLTFPGGSPQDQSGHSKGWTGYTWNRNLFPDPDMFLSKMHDEGLKVTLNLHPASGVQPFEQPYEAMARAMGQDPAQKKYVPFQITNRKFVENYFDILHHPLEKQGINFWWLDWQQEQHTDLEGVNPTFWLNYLHFTDQEREGKRPLLFHRWGGLGNHRYQIGFSGDVVSSWESLAFQPKFTATAANVGYAYWSHDIGGHLYGYLTPELYLRWLQFGEFSPILRTHTSKMPEAERRVWAYPEPYSDMMSTALRQRYAWIPYIYTEAHRTYESGVAFLHPLYYNWAEDDEAYRSANEYMFGDQLIVAPVTSAANEKTGLAEESVWLPKGEWIEKPTGTHIQGPVRLSRKFTLSETPVYEVAGGIIPKQPPMLYVGEKPVDPLTVEVSPQQQHQKSSYTLYEDSSEGRAYMTGHYATTELSAQRNGATLTVTIGPSHGSYPKMLTHRAYQIELPGDWPPSQVTVNGKPLHFDYMLKGAGWKFDGNTMNTIVRTEEFPVQTLVTVMVRRDATLMEHNALLQSFAGKMILLREANTELAGRAPVDAVTLAMQTGNRISYHPEHALEELTKLAAALPLLEPAVEKAAADQLKADDVAFQRSKNEDQDHKTYAEHRKTDHPIHLLRAEADVQAAMQLEALPK